MREREKKRENKKREKERERERKKKKKERERKKRKENELEIERKPGINLTKREKLKKGQIPLTENIIKCCKQRNKSKERLKNEQIIIREKQKTRNKNAVYSSVSCHFEFFQTRTFNFFGK